MKSEWRSRQHYWHLSNLKQRVISMELARSDNNTELTRCDTVLSRLKASVNWGESKPYVSTRRSSPPTLKWKKSGEYVLTTALFSSSLTINHTTPASQQSVRHNGWRVLWDKARVQQHSQLSRSAWVCSSTWLQLMITPMSELPIRTRHYRNKAFYRLRHGTATPLATHRHTAHYGQMWRHL